MGVLSRFRLWGISALCVAALAAAGCGGSSGSTQGFDANRGSSANGISYGAGGDGPRNPGPGTGTPFPFPAPGGSAPTPTPTPTPTPNPTPPPGASPTVFVSSESDGSVDVLDATDYSLVESIVVGGLPQGLSYDAVGNRVLVAQLGGDIPVIDVATRTVTGTISGGAAFEVVYDAASDAIFVPNYNAGQILAYEGDLPYDFRGDIGITLAPTELEVDTARGRLYATSNAVGNSRLASFDSSNLAATPIIVNTTDDANDYGDALCFDGSDTIYVGNDSLTGGGTDTIKVVDAVTLTVVQTVSAGQRVVSITRNFSSGQIYSVGLGDNSLHVFDADSGGLLSEVSGSPLTTGSQPIWVAYDAVRDRILVACRGDSTLHVYDAATLAPINGSPFPLQGTPQSVIVLPPPPA